MAVPLWSWGRRRHRGLGDGRRIRCRIRLLAADHGRDARRWHRRSRGQRSRAHASSHVDGNRARRPAPFVLGSPPAAGRSWTRSH